MKIRLPGKLLTTALLSLWLVNGCADNATKNPASKASPEAMAAIANASDAIKAAKANNWIWVNTEEFLKQNSRLMETVSDVLSIAMMLETQALDLYLRYSQKVKKEDTKTVLYNIAEEEKAHLATLGRLMESKAKEEKVERDTK